MFVLTIQQRLLRQDSPAIASGRLQIRPLEQLPAPGFCRTAGVMRVCAHICGFDHLSSCVMLRHLQVQSALAVWCELTTTIGRFCNCSLHNPQNGVAVMTSCHRQAPAAAAQPSWPECRQRLKFQELHPSCCDWFPISIRDGLLPTQRQA